MLNVIFYIYVHVQTCGPSYFRFIVIGNVTIIVDWFC